jgi:hypothetical protein
MYFIAARYFYLQNILHSNPVAHPASHYTGTRGTVDGNKTAVALSLPVTHNTVFKQRKKFPFVPQLINHFIYDQT